MQPRLHLRSSCGKCPCPPFIFLLLTFYSVSSEQVLVDSGMAIVPPARVRDHTLSHMPPPPSLKSSRERRTSEPSESGEEDTGHNDNEEETGSTNSSSPDDDNDDEDSAEEIDNDNDDTNEIDSADEANKNDNDNENEDNNDNIVNEDNNNDIENEDNNESGCNNKSNGEESNEDGENDGNTSPTLLHPPVQGGKTLVSAMPEFSEPIVSTSDQGSRVPTSALEHPGAGNSIQISSSSFCLYFHVLVTPPKIPDQGNFVFFLSLLKIQVILDVAMGSPPAMGSSHRTGGILRGRAHGNKLNHADFPKVTDIPSAVNQQVPFKVFAYLIYHDPITVNVIPDSSLHHNVSFVVSTIPPLDCALVLNKIAARLDSVTCKLKYNLLYQLLIISKLLIFLHNLTCLGHGCGTYLVPILEF